MTSMSVPLPPASRITRPARSRGRAPVRGWAIMLATAVALMGVAGCSDESAETLGPRLPYGDSHIPEDSVAVPVDTGGPVDMVADGLIAAGFFCAQVRSNATALQIWCRTKTSSLPPDGDGWVRTVDIVATPEGHLQYLRVDPPTAAEHDLGQDPPQLGNTDTVLKEILASSVLKIWPEDAEVIHGAIDDVREWWEFLPMGSDPREPRRTSANTKHANYFLGEGDIFGDFIQVTRNQPLTFIAVTDDFDGAWPTSSEHALTTTIDAAPGLEAGGFDCYGPRQAPCVLVDGNNEVQYDTISGSNTVTRASTSIHGGTNQDGEFATLADRNFPQGLTFLTDNVRQGIETRIDQARHDGISFVGIIEGVVVIIDARPLPRHLDGAEAVPVTVSVGTPLVSGWSDPLQ